MLPALAREAVPALLAVDRAEEACDLLAHLRQEDLADGRFRLLTAQVLIAQGEPAAARAVFEAGFEIPDLREGEETLSDTWYTLTERLIAGTGPVTDAVRAEARTQHPLPERYEFRMRPV